MKTCGECAWAIPRYKYQAGGVREDDNTNVLFCRRCAWAENDWVIGIVDKRDRCCPAFESVPLEIPDGHFQKCNECGKDFARCQHSAMGFQFAPLESVQ